MNTPPPPNQSGFATPLFTIDSRYNKIRFKLEILILNDFLQLTLKLFKFLISLFLKFVHCIYIIEKILEQTAWVCM